MNTFGRRLRIHLFGESHGAGVGAVLDGVPPGLPIDLDAVQEAMEQRRPGSGPLVSAREEPDRVEILSGVYQDRATGAPLALFVRNQDARARDYADLAHTPRPGHADLPSQAWSRGHHDPRGGGHHSGRLTAPLVAAGALVQPLLAACGVAVGAHVHQVGDLAGPANAHDAAAMQAALRHSVVHTAHGEMEDAFVACIEAARRAKDSVGGVVEFCAQGLPAGLGDPFFDSVESVVSHLLFAVPAVKGVSFGAGFAAARMQGSEHNDPYMVQGQRVVPATNHAGGVLGGRTTGAPVWGHVAVKPASSIGSPQKTVDLRTKEEVTIEVRGRHDPCIAVRAAPVVQACLCLAAADLLLGGMQNGLVDVPHRQGTAGKPPA